MLNEERQAELSQKGIGRYARIHITFAQAESQVCVSTETPKQNISTNVFNAIESLSARIS